MTTTLATTRPRALTARQFHELADVLSRAERNCTSRAEGNCTTERRGVSIKVSS